MPMKPFDVSRGILISALLSCAAGCMGRSTEDMYFAKLAPPSITLSFPDGVSQFPVGTDVPLKIVVRSEDGQGTPGTLIASIRRGQTIMNEAGATKPIMITRNERTYLVHIKGVPRAGKYDAVATGIMTLPPGKNPLKAGWSRREFHRVYSDRLPLEVTD